MFSRCPALKSFRGIPIEADRLAATGRTLLEGFDDAAQLDTPAGHSIVNKDKE
jgi:hypothetical protein